MKLPFLVVLNVVLLSVYLAEASTSAPKTKAITRMTNLVSPYFSASQYNLVFNDFEPLLYSMAPVSEIGGKFMGILMGRLTFGQTLGIAANGIGLLSQLSAITATLTEVCGNNLGAFYAQLNQVTMAYKAKGVSMDASLMRGYAKINQFATARRVETIMCRVRAKFGASWAPILAFSRAYLWYPYKTGVLMSHSTVPEDAPIGSTIGYNWFVPENTRLDEAANFSHFALFLTIDHSSKHKALEDMAWLETNFKLDIQ